MIDPFDNSALFPILLVVFVFVIAKILATLKLLNKTNADQFAKISSIITGICYAILFETAKDLGPLADIAIRVGSGIMVGGILWVFIYIGVSGAIKE